MAQTAEERGHFRGRFRTHSGVKVTASFDRKADGSWKIFSVGGVDVPTPLLPFSVMDLVMRRQTYPTLEAAKLAVKAA